MHFKKIPPKTTLTQRFGSGALGLIAITALSACSKDVHRFPLVSPHWVDSDRNHVSEEPSEYYSGLMADAADKNFLMPLARVPYLPLTERAQNVNSLDEVPNSSWFQNRIGYYDITPEEMVRGACGDTPSLNPEIEWEIIAAKPNGAYPGFFIKAGEERYLLKFDSAVQPGRATGSDVIGSKIYWAAGYNTPCNEIVHFTRDVLHIAKGATAEDKFGKKKPITKTDINTVLKKAYRTKDGKFRASASRFLPGRPLGPFRFQGKRGDDPNDHIAHQHRRELRGNRLLSAWLHHHDAREQNTLDVWMTDQGKNKNTDYIRHYMIDFGDCLGSRWAFDPLSKRFGYSYFVDYDQFMIDMLTLGAYPRPWHDVALNPEAEIFGYFNVKDFYPLKWTTEYPNSAHNEERFDDALWMARILARFTREQITAVVGAAQFDSPRAEAYLVNTLMGRRDKILKDYFTQYSPLSRIELVRRTPGSPTQSLCFDDLAIQSGVVNPERTFYKARLYRGRKLDDEIGWVQLEPDSKEPGRTCVRRPLGDIRPSDYAKKDAPDDDAMRYAMMKIYVHHSASLEPASSTRVFFYDLGPERGFQMVGIEHPNVPVTPDYY